ncbi:hypothetical protein [Lentzea sp. NPDC004782]|uniref:hypothetical protein n=1 Tax=Lentzea sp. NPDC004782 TaxID=3154458 RepID=UPI0033A60770
MEARLMGSAPFNVVIEMNSLYLARPSANASDDTVAAWYRAKGRLHERIAAEGDDDAVQELAYATASYEHAIRLERRSSAEALRQTA